jgi:hypothetical protein
MLIPQFSLRWMLAVMAVLAVFFLVVARAAQGNAWAVGVSVSVAMLAVVAAVHATMFFVIWLVSLWTARRRRPAVVPVPATAATPFQPGANGDR